MPKNRLFSDDLRRFHPTLLLEGRSDWVFFPMKYCQTQKCFNENARSERPPGHEVGGKCQKLPEKPCFRRFPASSLGESLRFPDPNDFNAASKSASLPKTPYSQRGEIDRYSSDGPMGGRTDGRQFTKWVSGIGIPEDISTRKGWPRLHAISLAGSTFNVDRKSKRPPQK